MRAIGELVACGTQYFDWRPMIHSSDHQLRRGRQVIRALELPMTLALAEVAALSFDELLQRLERIWTESESKLIIDRLVNMDLDISERAKILVAIQSLDSRSSTLALQHRRLIENSIFRLLRLIPLSISRDYVLECLRHGRATMRRAAYRAYRSNGVDPAALQFLLHQYKCRRKGSSGQEVLQLIARCPEAVDQLNVDYLLEEISEDYWRMRMLENLVSKNKIIPEVLRIKYPIEYIWAIVRSGNRMHLPFIRHFLNKHRNNADYARWCIWAFGRLGSQEDIELSRTIVESLVAEASDWSTLH